MNSLWGMIAFITGHQYTTLRNRGRFFMQWILSEKFNAYKILTNLSPNISHDISQKIREWVVLSVTLVGICFKLLAADFHGMSVSCCCCITESYINLQFWWHVEKAVCLVWASPLATLSTTGWYSSGEAEIFWRC